MYSPTVRGLLGINFALTDVGEKMRTLLLLLSLHCGRAAIGILDLDNTTFDRVIDGSVPALVRFDKENSYGDADDAWQEVGKVSASARV